MTKDFNSMDGDSKMHVGIVGFNVIEECGIIRWGREFFPQVEVRKLNAQDEPGLMDGMVISDRVYPEFTARHQRACPILLLANGALADPFPPNVSALNTMGNTIEVEGGIALWLTLLLQPDTLRQRKQRSVKLSPRETEIVQMIRQGLGNDAIGKSLGIEVTTVKTHLQRIFTKLGAVNRAHAVAIFNSMR